jgi:hypothetical protein
MHIVNHYIFLKKASCKIKSLDFVLEHGMQIRAAWHGIKRNVALEQKSGRKKPSE